MSSSTRRPARAKSSSARTRLSSSLARSSGACSRKGSMPRWRATCQRSTVKARMGTDAGTTPSATKRPHPSCRILQIAVAPTLGRRPSGCLSLGTAIVPLDFAYHLYFAPFKRNRRTRELRRCGEMPRFGERRGPVIRALSMAFTLHPRGSRLGSHRASARLSTSYASSSARRDALAQPACSSKGRPGCRAGGSATPASIASRKRKQAEFIA
jgi:hypothetical protein